MIATDYNLFKEYRIKQNALGKYGIVRADTSEVVIEYLFDKIEYINFEVA